VSHCAAFWTNAICKTNYPCLHNCQQKAQTRWWPRVDWNAYFGRHFAHNRGMGARMWNVMLRARIKRGGIWPARGSPSFHDGSWSLPLATLLLPVWSSNALLVLISATANAVGNTMAKLHITQAQTPQTRTTCYKLHATESSGAVPGRVALLGLFSIIRV